MLDRTTGCRFIISSEVCLSSVERETAATKYRAAPGTAMTDNGAILLFSHSPSVIAFSSAKPSQAMRAADREPAGGEIPVELVCRQPFDDFP